GRRGDLQVVAQTNACVLATHRGISRAIERQGRHGGVVVAQSYIKAGSWMGGYKECVQRIHRLAHAAAGDHLYVTIAGNVTSSAAWLHLWRRRRDLTVQARAHRDAQQ